MYEILGVEQLPLFVLGIDIACEDLLGKIEIVGTIDPAVSILLNGDPATIDRPSQLISNLTAGEYELAYQISTDCIISFDTVVILGSLMVELYFDSDTLFSINGAILFVPVFISSSASDAFYEISWELNNQYLCASFNDAGQCIEINLEATESEIITVNIVDENNCKWTTNIVVKVVDESVVNSIFIPNAFSTNNDGINDRFIVFSKFDEGLIHSFEIFNRWGGKVYSRRNMKLQDLNFWDGFYKNKPLPEGLYVYTFEMILSNGESYIDYGEITLIR